MEGARHVTRGAVGERVHPPAGIPGVASTPTRTLTSRRAYGGDAAGPAPGDDAHANTAGKRPGPLRAANSSGMATTGLPLTVASLDVGVATLLSSELHVIHFPRLLLPPDAKPGAVVTVAVRRAYDEEQRCAAAPRW